MLRDGDGIPREAALPSAGTDPRVAGDCRVSPARGGGRSPVSGNARDSSGAITSRPKTLSAYAQ
ncbi:hypothetical protein GCM10010349_37760 [Streptomyces flavofungini]|nr:hypothetical protein GCM10010349_37760 [Streptomyces flavofungini]